MDLPTDIEIIGDLAKVKISEKVYPYRFTVGQVVQDKNPKLRAVYCYDKDGKLECIAGAKGRVKTITIEDKARFKLDIS